MKIIKISILFVIAILLAVMMAGCTTSPRGPAATTTPGGASTAPTATVASSGGLTTLGSAIDFSKVHWWEYNMASKSGEGTTNSKIKMEYNVDYKGQQANRMTITMDMSEGGTTMTTVTEMYVDKSNNNLGGHMKTMQGSQVIFEQDIPASSSSGGATTASDPFGTSSGAALTGAGAESVSVPAGNFACTKYTYSASGTTGTVWVSPSVPLPIKMESRSEYGTMTMELAGWG